ncbi:uncharacterized protein JCM15063_002962 [Sporobolomyces koalae]|uniref:uncharacterized protein n=1 Tax=Sporobolomyces koalae TaxID=500713 RepID=UPI00317A7616
MPNEHEHSASDNPRKREKRRSRKSRSSNQKRSDHDGSTTCARAERPAFARQEPLSIPGDLYEHCAYGDWTECQAYSFPEPPVPNSIKLLTWNVWTSSYEHKPAQTTAILDLLSSARVDLVSLQEVSQDFEESLREQPWIEAEWALTRLEDYWYAAGRDGQGRGKKIAKREGVILMVKRERLARGFNLEFIRLGRADNEQAKAAIVLTLLEKNRPQLRVVTSHYSSLPHNDKLRRMQYSTSLALLRAAPAAAHCVLLGDFNSSSNDEFDLFSPTLRDVAPGLPKSQLSGLNRTQRSEAIFRSRATFGELYPLVTPTSYPRKPRRIDRIYVSKHTRSSQYSHMGDEPIVGGKDRLGKGGKSFPSDHLAVRVQIDLSVPLKSQGTVLFHLPTWACKSPA